jgi:hypothetical protein
VTEEDYLTYAFANLYPTPDDIYVPNDWHERHNNFFNKIAANAPFDAVVSLFSQADRKISYSVYGEHDAVVSWRTPGRYHSIDGQGFTPAVALMNAWMKYLNGVEAEETEVSSSDILQKLQMARIGSCNCQTKTYQPNFHDPSCLYRILHEAYTIISLGVQP